MKRNLLTAIFCLSLTGSIFAQYPAKVGTLPAYPKADDTVKVLINIKNWPNMVASEMDVYSGLITSKSKDNGDWQNTLGDWNNHPDSLKMVMENDSIYSFTINNIKAYYKAGKNDEVYNIKFIARDKSGHQTEDLQLEVFDNDFSAATKLVPANVTEDKFAIIDLNLNRTTKTLKDYMAAHKTDTVFAYSAVNTNLGDWNHTVADWGKVSEKANSKLRLITVSDSIYRLYINPSVRKFYGIDNPAVAVKTMNFVFRNADGSAQTEDFVIPIQYTAPAIISDVKDVLVYPSFPTVTDKVFIYVNANAYPFDSTSGLTAYTGLITSKSTDNKDGWKNIANKDGDWNDISLKLDRINDSIHVFTIPSIKDFYKVEAGDEVYRITFIARDTAAGKPSKQTSNIYFEVFAKNPTALFSTQPAKLKEGMPVVITLNVNQDTKTLAKYLADTTDTEVYAYTGINKDWTNQPAEWGDVGTMSKLQSVMVNDSIYRFYMMPAAREFYAIEDTCTHIYTANFVFRNKAGNAQTADITLQFDTAAYVKCPTGISDIRSAASVSVYPNPAVNEIVVSANDMISEIRISNLVGQQLKSVQGVNNNSAMVSVSDLPNGIYIFMIRTSNNQITTGKLIKK